MVIVVGVSEMRIEQVTSRLSALNELRFSVSVEEVRRREHVCVSLYERFLRLNNVFYTNNSSVILDCI